MLTDIQVRRAKPGEKPYKLADSGGLFLHVSTTGAKSWRLKYRWEGREKLLTFGLYPGVTLSAARDARDEAKRAIREGRDPAKGDDDAGVSLEAATTRWHEKNKGRWTARHADDVINSLRREVFPSLGAKPIRAITSTMILAALEKVEDRGAIETARRIRQRISEVFAFAIGAGLADNDPATPVKSALRPPKQGKKQPAIITLPAARKLITAVESTPSSPITRLAHRLLSLTAVRPGELRGARWEELEDLEKRLGVKNGEEVDISRPLWRIPAERMKLKRERKSEEVNDHLVPLSRQAVEVLQVIRPLTGDGDLVFPGGRRAEEPLSENAIGYLINRAGYHGRHVPHGWRAAFSTIMNEQAERAGRHGDRAVIDLMLAHVPKERVEGAYNRAPFIERRREIAQEWADLILQDAAPAEDLLSGQRRSAKQVPADHI